MNIRKIIDKLAWKLGYIPVSVHVPINGISGYSIQHVFSQYSFTDKEAYADFEQYGKGFHKEQVNKLKGDILRVVVDQIEFKQVKVSPDEYRMQASLFIAKINP